MTFTEVDIYHRMELLRMSYFMTLNFIFKVKNFLVMHWLYNNAQAAIVPQQICLDSHSPRRGVALVGCTSLLMKLGQRILVTCFMKLFILFYQLHCGRNDMQYLYKFNFIINCDVMYCIGPK